MASPRVLVVLAALCVLLIPACAYVAIDSNRLLAEMKYWMCSADGETADVLLHVMAEKTVKESQSKNAAVGCATFTPGMQAVNAAVAGRKWLPPKSETGKAESWAGCGNAKCLLTKNAVPLKLETPTYVRMLEFGHEQAGDCKDPIGAINAFVQGLIKAGCSSRVCNIMDYVAARPAGCKALVA